METIKTEVYKGFNINIVADNDTESPREWDNLGTMVCFHRNYNLGDKTSYSESDFDSWGELKAQLVKDGARIILPLGLYDHSGITMYIGNNHDRWDGGQVGFIYVTAENIRKEYSVKKITKKILAQAEELLRGEVKTYDKYLTGDVVGFQVEDTDENMIDSCYGYYDKDDAIAEAKSIIDGEVADRQAKREAKLKAYIKNNVPLSNRNFI
jgi:hypothetical protein